MNILSISASRGAANSHSVEVWAKGGEGGIALAEKVLETLEKKTEQLQGALSRRDEPEGEDRHHRRRGLRRGRRDLRSGGGEGVKAHRPRWASATCRSAWPRPSIPCPTTRLSLARPTGFKINVRDAYVSAGAGFVVALTGSIMTMPGTAQETGG